jgi:hypothetical protein
LKLVWLTLTAFCGQGQEESELDRKVKVIQRAYRTARDRRNLKKHCMFRPFLALFLGSGLIFGVFGSRAAALRASYEGISAQE